MANLAMISSVRQKYEALAPLLHESARRSRAAGPVSCGQDCSSAAVGRMRVDLGYSLQANRKTEEGQDHPDRDAQFEHINAKVRSFQRRGQPVVSVDTKKKEIVGNYRNSGREWEPRGRPRRVKSKDFPDKELGKVAPYGVYDLTVNEGWVSV